jgi:hypothetical protein
MFRVSLQNANRAGVLSSLGIGHMKKGKRGKDESFTVHIASHKTSSAYGGALMSFDLALHDHENKAMFTSM